MAETNLVLLPQEEVTERVQQGLLAPVGADGSWEVIDCGDVRKLTDYSLQHRVESHGHDVFPGRYFGAASGLAVTALIAIAAQMGEERLKRFITEHGEHALANFAADLSQRAADTEKTEITQHTANGNEQNDSGFSHEDDHGPLGCKFNALSGFVLFKTVTSSTLQEAQRIASLSGTDLPLEEAQYGGQILSRYLPADFSVTRHSLKQAGVSPDNPARRLTVLDGAGYTNEQTAVVIDMARYKASAAAHIEAGIPRYQHTPNVASDTLAKLLPEFKLDDSLVKGAALLIGSGTRHALSGESTPHDLAVEIIPPQSEAA